MEANEFLTHYVKREMLPRSDLYLDLVMRAYGFLLPIGETTPCDKFAKIIRETYSTTNPRNEMLTIFVENYKGDYNMDRMGRLSFIPV